MADEFKKIICNKLDVITDGELRRCLKHILFELDDRRDCIREELLKRLDDEIKANKKVLKVKIATKLCQNSEEMIERSGFEVMDGGCPFFQNREVKERVEELVSKPFEFHQQHFFLNVPYEDKEKYLGRAQAYSAKYKDKSFEFWLRDNSRFVQEENRIIAALRLYGIVDPIIFSPWSRKAVDIELSSELDEKSVDDIKKNLGNVDWQLNENGLANILLIDHVLLWNVKWVEKFDSKNTFLGSKGWEKVAPDGSLKSYEYIYSTESENQFICVEDLGKNFSVHPSIEEVFFEDCKIHVISRDKLHNDDDRDGVADNAKLFEVKDIFEEKVYLFRNNDCSCNDKNRLRTIGDIQWVLERFAKQGFRCAYDRLEMNCRKVKKNDSSIDMDVAKEHVVRQYSDIHKYYHDEKQLYFKTRSKCPKIVLKFTAEDGLHIFLTDYANYVLYNLNYMYPEFCWSGVTE